MKIYNVYLDGKKDIFCTYISKEKAENMKKYPNDRIEEGEVGGINIWEVSQKRCLQELLEEEKWTLREYQSEVSALTDGYTTINKVLKAQTKYENVRQAIADYFSAM